MEGLLEGFRDLDTSEKCIYVVGGVVVTVVSAVIIRKLLPKQKKHVYPRNTVILHQIDRGPHAPSMSPFPVKLETYLRMARIPYQNVHAKGKFPWIEYNGEVLGDTTLCIDFLNKKLGINLNKHLSPEEKGIAQSMQVMTEEHLFCFRQNICVDEHKARLESDVGSGNGPIYRRRGPSNDEDGPAGFVRFLGIMCVIRWRYYKDSSMLYQAFGRIFVWMSIRPALKVMWAQGMGRYTEGEVPQMMKMDLQALSDFLGEKKFLMGDEPSEVDCAVFGQLSQFYWQFLGTDHDTIIKDRYPMLAAYCERMKTTFWPDWDECYTQGGTREAPK